jgi:2-succinyl-5-enolpyruvyl-6-hydroxy-3-cyclohexene-1-carboxylate synthase
VRIDERSAGFLALGLAIGSGIPAAVMCTSGTAVANLHPAVIEADLSGVPLIVITANRPAEVLGTGANQTIDQQRIFGDATRLTAQIPAGLGSDPNSSLRGRVSRVLAAADGPSGRSGPVHLDIAFAPPLVPSGALDPLQVYPGRPDGVAWTTFEAAAPAQVELVVADRTLVVVGDASWSLAHSAVETAAVHGIPCHVEAGPALGHADETCLQAGPWLLADQAFIAAAKPDMVVVVGRPTLGRALGHLIADVLDAPADEAVITRTRNGVAALTRKFPVYRA